MRKKVIPPDVGEEEVEEVEEPKKEGKSVKIKGDMPVDVKVALERIATQIKALNEIREGNDERFARISEQMGEIRSMVIDNEKHMRDIEIKATKASDLVNAIKPETLSTEVKKIDAKVEAAKGKIEAGKSINDSIVEELKNIKRQMNLFKGTDAIFKLNEDVKKELINIQKIKAIIEGHADKIEQIFIEIQKNFSDFQKLGDKTENIAILSSGLQKELNNLKMKFQTLPNKKDLDNLRKLVHLNSDKVNKQFKDIRKNKDLIALLKSIEVKLISSIGNNISDLKKEKNKVNKDIKDIYDFLDKLAKKINKGYPDKQIEEIQKQLNENTKQRDELLKVVEMIEKKVYEKYKRKT